MLSSPASPLRVRLRTASAESGILAPGLQGGLASPHDQTLAPPSPQEHTATSPQRKQAQPQRSRQKWGLERAPQGTPARTPRQRQQALSDEGLRLFGAATASTALTAAHEEKMSALHDVTHTQTVTVQVGQRVHVMASAGSRHSSEATVRVPFFGSGTVRFVGRTAFAQGLWVGVELSQQRGRNDGAVHGTRYFRCGDRHGIFVRPSRVVPQPHSPP